MMLLITWPDVAMTAVVLGALILAFRMILGAEK
jgi:uncharacterized MnhB-related membrane protein